MNKKIMSRVFYIIAAKYNIGVTMGIVMISIFVVSLIVGIVLTILAGKELERTELK